MEWKQIAGYEGLYEVSDTGLVRSVDRMVKGRNGHLQKKNGKLLAVKYEKNGYARYRLSKDGVATDILAHRIVAIAFIDNPNGYKTVNHIDENKHNNSVSNLEWCDMHYQNTYGVGAYNRNNAKERPVVQYSSNGEFIKRFSSIKDASEELGIRSSCIWASCRKYGRTKFAGGFDFKYESEVMPK